MTDGTLPEILTRLRESEFSQVTINPGWAQGRAVFGGLGAAVALTGMESLVDPTCENTAPLRSLMTNFVAPMPEALVTADARILRRGRAVTQTSVDVRAGEQIVVHASAAFGVGRETVTVSPEAAFSPELRDSVPAMDAGALKLPGFLKRFDIHWTGGGIPRSGSQDRRTGMWVRHKDNMEAFPTAKIVALADIPPPVMLSHYTKPVMASSLSWSLEFIRPANEIKSDWFYLDYTLEAAADGYSQQNGQIFTEDGVLVALSRQCMVYFE